MCGGQGIEVGPDVLDPPTPAQQLCEYVVFRANRGDDVATILAGALEVFSEEPPPELTSRVMARVRARLEDDRRAAEVHS